MGSAPPSGGLWHEPDSPCVNRPPPSKKSGTLGKNGGQALFVVPSAWLCYHISTGCVIISMEHRAPLNKNFVLFSRYPNAAKLVQWLCILIIRNKLCDFTEAPADRIWGGGGGVQIHGYPPPNSTNIPLTGDSQDALLSQPVMGQKVGSQFWLSGSCPWLLTSQFTSQLKRKSSEWAHLALGF